MAERKTGTMKWFSWAKGFGFIRPDPDGNAPTKDLCAVISPPATINAVGGYPNIDGHAVEYTLGADRNGKVRVLNITAPGGGPLGRGGRGGGGSYGHGSGRGLRCDTCGAIGHSELDYTATCGGCFIYGEDGHVPRKCPKRGSACYTCLGYGHIARNCPKSSGGASGSGGGFGGCYNCGDTTHIARFCTQSGGVYSRGGGGGGGYGGGFGGCYNCGDTTHIARFCTLSSGGGGGYGGRGGGGGGGYGRGRGGGTGCYKCGLQGHIARNCLNRR